MSARSDFDSPRIKARDAHLNAIRDELKTFAATVPDPPTPAQVDDLWAHARQHTDDGELAFTWVHHLLALGWRPLGGAS